jgi:hypothetical protein
VIINRKTQRYNIPSNGATGWVRFINLVTFGRGGKRGKVNKNSPFKIEGVPFRGRECAKKVRKKNKQRERIFMRYADFGYKL